MDSSARVLEGTLLWVLGWGWGRSGQRGREVARARSCRALLALVRPVVFPTNELGSHGAREFGQSRV